MVFLRISTSTMVASALLQVTIFDQFQKCCCRVFDAVPTKIYDGSSVDTKFSDLGIFFRHTNEMNFYEIISSIYQYSKIRPETSG